MLYITVGVRQLSWHIHPRDADLYRHVEHVPADDPRAQWDGHTTAEKYEAIREMTFGELRGPVGTPLICCDERHQECVAALTTRAEQAEARIAAVRALHRPVECVNVRCQLKQWRIGCDPEGVEGCSDNPWPCPTIRALDAIDAAAEARP